jgi:hypothetical protein
MSTLYLDTIQFSKLGDLIARNNQRKIPFRAIKSVLASWGFHVQSKGDVEKLLVRSIEHAKDLRNQRSSG